MSNSIKKSDEILQDFLKEESVGKILKNAHLYYAHRPSFSNSEKSVELLSEHLDLVHHYFGQLVDAHHLDGVIDSLIKLYLQDAGHTYNSEIANYLKKLFVHTITYHDHGKINENFQASPEKMNNPNFCGRENKNNKIGTYHSTLSSYIFLCRHFDEIIQKFSNKKEQNLLISATIAFSYPIYQHHSKYLNDDFKDKIIWQNAEYAEVLKEYLKYFKITFKQDFTPFLMGLQKVLNHPSFSDTITSFPLYQLIRLNFSLLTAADYLATNEYMSNDKTKNFGVFPQSRANELFNHITESEWLNKEEGKRNYNRKTYLELETLSLKKPLKKNNTNLNSLRQQMAAEAIKNLRNNLNKSLFYLEAPTGGGKTNISMLLSIELLKSEVNLNKVFYVFPFTTLVDQTYKSLKESLNLKEDEIVKLHSKTSFGSDEMATDDDYGSKRKNYIDYLFVNYPFCLLTHIKFFNILKTNRKEENYLLHRMANSVVILDELQSYSPEHWDKVIYFIQEYSKIYNIKFVLMSATLPKLNKLNLKNDISDFVYLLPNAREDYFQNPNFSKRVGFNFELLKSNLTLTSLAEIVLDKSHSYAQLDFGSAKPSRSVYTIIEFIFKKSATLFYGEMQKIHNGFFDDILVLSGTILEHRRRYIINKLKNETSRNKRIMLITTQVVEAGVDIDMDLGFKDKSLLDSDEQLAGRINRNVKKDKSILYLFDYDKESVIYGKDIRHGVSMELSTEFQKQILETKNFDLLYDRVIEFIDKNNADQFREGFNDYLNLLDGLKFKSINDQFQLIEQENMSCFVPLKIPCEVTGQTDDKTVQIFSNQDLFFLQKNGVLSNNGKIDGAEVYDLYCKIIEAKMDFLKKKIELRQMQSILSKYIFSLFASAKLKKEIVHFSNPEKSEYGFEYLERWKDFYDEHFGIDDSKLNSIETQFL